MKRSGIVAICGQTNVGKSTLINNILGKKVAITSDKPETTRDNIRGILTEKDYQIVFVDSPGVHKPKSILGKIMLTQAQSSILEADIILMLVEKKTAFSEDDMNILSLFPENNTKTVILVINKSDIIKPRNLILPMIEKAKTVYDFDEIIPMSSLNTSHTSDLVKILLKYLPEKEFIFPEDQITDKSDEFAIKEIIREKVLLHTYQELPHSTAVIIDDLTDEGNITRIHATVLVDKISHRAIILGKEGSMIKKIGKAARMDIEKHFSKRIYLDLWIKVIKNWKKDPESLRDAGYGD